MSDSTSLLPFQPATMSTAQLAAASFLARYSGRTHPLYPFQLRQWFGWCQVNGLDPLIGVQRAHVELYIRSLGEGGLMESSVVTMMHGVRGFFRFAHIDGRRRRLNNDQGPRAMKYYIVRQMALADSVADAVQSYGWGRCHRLLPRFGGTTHESPGVD